MAIDGKYVRIKVTTAEPGLAIRPDPTLDLSLADLVDRILPLTYYYGIYLHISTHTHKHTHLMCVCVCLCVHKVYIYTHTCI